MADPVVHITNGVPDSGTGNITTLGQTLVDGANATLGITTGAAVTTDSPGTIQQYLRGMVTVMGASLPAGTNTIGNVISVPNTSGGLSRSRTLIPNNTTAIVVKSGAGQLYKIRAMNNSANIAYIKLYDATSATAGVGTPVDTIMIPAATAGGAGVVDTTDLGVAHSTGITYIVTTGYADNDTTAPAASAYIVTMYYK